MMIGETQRHHQIHVPPWQQQPHTTTTTPPPQLSSSPVSLSLSSSSVQSNSPTYYDAVLASLRRYLLSDVSGGGGVPDMSDPPPSPGEFSGEMDCFSSEYDFDDEFFMYDFKVRKCTRARAHDWTECPFAHPGEKARRRDPRKYNYSGTACTEFRKGGCKKGDACEFAHGVFECWLHPARFRTQACKDGPGCKRRVCFFAHTPDQLRAAGSGLPSPRGSPRGGGYMSGSDDTAVGELVASIRNLQLNKVKSMPVPVRNVSGGGCSSPVFGSPRGIPGRAGFFSLPTTPTRPGARFWDTKEAGEEDEMMMERVESGRELRARMFEKLSKENPLDGSGSPLSSSAPGPGPDFGWVCDLIE